MYRIMIVKAKKDNYQSAYQYLTATVNGVVSPVELDTKEALDKYVEGMLNEGYAKSDFIIVKPIEYSIDAINYSDDGSDVTPANPEE